MELHGLKGDTVSYNGVSIEKRFYMRGRGHTKHFAHDVCSLEDGVLVIKAHFCEREAVQTNHKVLDEIDMPPSEVGLGLGLGGSRICGGPVQARRKRSCAISLVTTCQKQEVLSPVYGHDLHFNQMLKMAVI